MDSGAMAGWIVALGTLVALWLTIHYRNTDAGIVKVNEMLKPVDERISSLKVSTSEQVATLKTYHNSHFKDARENARNISTLGQQLTDHVAQDEERFERMEKMQREIRDDIKELMKRT